MFYWISPSGEKFKSSTKTAEEAFRKATASFPVAKGKGDYFQDNGIYSPSYSLIFEFDNIDDSEYFIESLSETGNSTVIDPTKYVLRNCQVLAFNKRKGLVKDNNRFVFTVEFNDSYYENAKDQFTELSVDSLLVGVDNDSTNTSSEFGLNTNFDLVNEKISIGFSVSDSLTKFNDFLELNIDEIQNKVFDLLATPSELAIQMRRLIETPINTYSDSVARLRAYHNMLIASLTPTQNYNLASTDSTRSNYAYYNEMNGANILNAMTSNVLNLPFTSKSQVAEVNALLVNGYKSYRTSLDSLQSNGFFQQNGTVQQSISELIYSTSGYLNQISFDLKSEFTFEVEDDTTTSYDIAVKYYLEELKIDEQGTIDYVENTNNLDEYSTLEIPKGTEVKVYV